MNILLSVKHHPHYPITNSQKKKCRKETRKGILFGKAGSQVSGNNFRFLRLRRIIHCRGFSKCMMSVTYFMYLIEYLLDFC